MVEEKTKLMVLVMMIGEMLNFRNRSVRSRGMNPRRRRSNENEEGSESNFQQSSDKMSCEAEGRVA